MKLIFKDTNITKYLLNFSIEYSIDNIFSTLSFSIPHEIIKKYKLREGERVKISGKIEFEGICIKYSDNNNETGKFEALSKSWYLSVYEDTCQVNSNADEAIKSIIKNYNKEFNIDIKSSDFSYKINKIYYNITLEAMIENIFAEISSKKGKDYYLIDKGNKLQIIDKGEIKKINISNILSMNRNFDISKIKNKIKVISTDENEVSTSVSKENYESIQKIGLIQKIHKIESLDPVQAKKEAEKLLALNSKIKSSLSLKLLGDYSLSIGDIAHINGKFFLIKKVKHSINNGIHLSHIETEAYDG